jgi:hypothetical protein
MRTLTLVLLVAAIGCGSDSKSSGGVDPTLVVADLTPGEVTEECTFIIANFPSKMATCSDGSTVTVNNQTEAQCEGMLGAVPSTCTVTVGTAEDCLAALEADPCNGTTDPSCVALFDASCQ